MTESKHCSALCCLKGKSCRLNMMLICMRAQWLARRRFSCFARCRCDVGNLCTDSFGNSDVIITVVLVIISDHSYACLSPPLLMSWVLSHPNVT